MYEMKIAAGARSEHAAATPGVDTSKDTQNLWNNLEKREK